MQVGWKGALVFLAVYAAFGLPEIRECLNNGGALGSCALAGMMVGSLKMMFQLFVAAISGFAHLMHS
jgi:hypothetical protein